MLSDVSLVSSTAFGDRRLVIINLVVRFAQIEANIPYANNLHNFPYSQISEDTDRMHM